MPKTPSFGLDAGAASAGGALPGAGSAGSAFGGGGGGSEVSGTASTRIPGFLFSGTHTSAGADTGHAGGAGGYTSSGNNLGGRVEGAMGGGAVDHTVDEMPAKTMPFQSLGDHHHRGSTTAADVALIDCPRNDREGPSTSDQPPSADDQQQKQRHQQRAGVDCAIDSSELVPSSALRTSPRRLQPSKSMIDTWPSSVVQPCQPSKPGSFTRATTRTSSGYAPDGGMLTTPGAGGAGDSPLTGTNASKWITVFGFTVDMESQALREFRSHGDVLRTVPGKGNWMHILYRTLSQAQVALYRPWRILNESDVMVGAVPCTEPEVEGLALHPSGADIDKQGKCGKDKGTDRKKEERTSSFIDVDTDTSPMMKKARLDIDADKNVSKTTTEKKRALHPFFTAAASASKKSDSKSDTAILNKNLNSRGLAGESLVEAIDVDAIRCKKPRLELDEDNDVAKTTAEKKRVLHPFFAATAAAISSTREKVNVPRLERPVCDAWTYGSATVHVNFASPLAKPCSTIPPPQETSNTPLASPVKGSKRRGCRGSVGRRPRLMKKGQKECPDVMNDACLAEKYGYHPRTAHLVSYPSERREVVTVATQSDAWSEKYRTDSRIDVINATATDELTEWLKPWYVKPMGRAQTGDSDDYEFDMYDDENILAELDDSLSEERDRIAVLSGPVGCGKSTVISTAAKRLGLSVLEINAGVCRTGRRVRDIVGEALRTHRVMHGAGGRGAASSSSLSLWGDYGGCTNGGSGVGNGGGGSSNNHPSNSNNSRSKKARTLIVFEEVDELQADEKGFWTSVLELATSDSCKRPIICTANTFTSAMRQMFVKRRKGVSKDMYRLFVTVREEQNPSSQLCDVPFKHITFPDTRSERQTMSVVQRIAKVEKVSGQRQGALVDCFGVMYRHDTRRAINALHFWGANGLEDAKMYGGKLSIEPSPPPSPPPAATRTRTTRSRTAKRISEDLDAGRSGEVLSSKFSNVGSGEKEKWRSACGIRDEDEMRGMSMFRGNRDGVNDCNLVHAVFWVGIDRFLGSEEFKRRGKKGGTGDDDDDTLGMWAEALEGMSVADTMLGTSYSQTMSRNAENRLSPDAICLDADILRLQHMTEDVCVQSLRSVRGVLQVELDGADAGEVARALMAQSCSTNKWAHDLAVGGGGGVGVGPCGSGGSGVHLNRSPFMPFMPCMPGRPCMPVFTDYLPTLVSMVRGEEAAAKQRGDGHGVVDQPRRRTRAKTKQSGLGELDLDAATILLLKKCRFSNTFLSV